MTGPESRWRRGWLLCLCLIAGVLWSALALRTDLQGDDATAELPPLTISGAEGAIELVADWGQEWTEDQTSVALFRNACRVSQGANTFTADKMVVWSRTEKGTKGEAQVLTIYLEGRVSASGEYSAVNESSRLIEMRSPRGVYLQTRAREQIAPKTDDPLYVRAVQRRGGPRRQSLYLTQYTVGDSSPGVPAQTIDLPTAQGLRRIRMFPRSVIPYTIDSYRSNDTTPPEQVALVTGGGITLLIDGLDLNGTDPGTIDLSADRVVIWTTALTDEPFSDAPQLQSRDMPFQVYLEGNIVIRQGDNVIRAERAFYDAKNERALVLNAQLDSFFPQLGVNVRMRADRIRQLSKDEFQAQNAWITTSRYGKPGYRVQSSSILYQQRVVPSKVGMAQAVDPQTGQPLYEKQGYATALGTTLFIDDVPTLYAPRVSGPVEDFNSPLQSASFAQDNVFGTQFRSQWDGFKVFGIDPVPGTKWTIGADFLSRRGPAFYTKASHEGLDPWGNHYLASGTKWGIFDYGHDNLGFDRRDLVPNHRERGILDLQFRDDLPNDMIFQSEIGYASDRNVREQFFERQFDRGKDLEVDGYLRQYIDDWSWSVFARPTLNLFENNTQWLPKGDLFNLGSPLLNNYLTWSSHSSAGYGMVNQARPPSNPALDAFTPLPYYVDGNGAYLMTRHQLEAPLDLGPLKITPYALGEVAHWGDSLSPAGGAAGALDRVWGKAGVRGSITAWRAFPYVRSEIFNLNGLAHKSTIDLDYSYARANHDISSIAQWNEFEDNAQERFRERFFTTEFGGVLPASFDPRFYAIRSGAGSGVADPYNELVGNMHVLRGMWRNRLQTKVGPPEQQRIKDWMTLDLGISYFPDPSRDDFGKSFGLATSRYAWYLGDRTTLLASSTNDFFSGGQQIWNVGINTQRTYRGSFYVGVMQIKGGPIDSEILTASYTYNMSPKWVSTMSTAYDLREHLSRGQSLTITRVGADFLIHAGFNVDVSKNNVGAIITVEPRFLKPGGNSASSTQLGPLVGPPSGF